MHIPEDEVFAYPSIHVCHSIIFSFPEISIVHSCYANQDLKYICPSLHPSKIMYLNFGEKTNQMQMIGCLGNQIKMY